MEPCERRQHSDLRWTLRGMPASPWVMENWPGSATILAVRCKGTRDGKPVDVYALEPRLCCNTYVVAGRTASLREGFA
jgi:hypothetical protein